jgi:hypothetical protein
MARFISGARAVYGMLPDNAGGGRCCCSCCCGGGGAPNIEGAGAGVPKRLPDEVDPKALVDPKAVEDAGAPNAPGAPNPPGAGAPNPPGAGAPNEGVEGVPNKLDEGAGVGAPKSELVLGLGTPKVDDGADEKPPNAGAGVGVDEKENALPDAGAGAGVPNPVTPNPDDMLPSMLLLLLNKSSPEVVAPVIAPRLSAGIA